MKRIKIFFVFLAALAGLTLAHAEEHHYVFVTDCLGEVRYSSFRELTPDEALAIMDDLEALCDIDIEYEGELPEN